MIYTDKFVWIHLPKCAGSKTEQLFKKYYSGEDGVFQDIVNPDIDPEISWHDTIAEREARDVDFKLGSRTYVNSVGFRHGWKVNLILRLPEIQK